MLPPDNSPGAIRVLRIVEHLVQLGWSIRVIGTSISSGRTDPALLKRWPPQVKISYVKFIHPYFLTLNLCKRLRNYLNGFYIAKPNEVDQVLSGKSRITMRHRARKIFHRLVYEHYYPDINAPWIKPAMQQIAALHQTEPADLLLTTSGPWSTLFIGYFASFQTGLPWVSDYRDPWTLVQSQAENQRKIGSKDKDHFWQQKFLDQCSSALVVSEEIRDAYIQQYQVDETKLKIFPIGYDDFPLYRDGAGVSQDKFVVKYVGNMAMMILEPFLKSLSAWLANRPERRAWFRLRFIGEIGEEHLSQIAASGLTDITELAGVVNRQEAWEETCSATILLLLWYDKNIAYSPGSKLFTYLASRRPVLALVPPGTGARMVEESGQGVVVHPDNSMGIHNVLEILWEAWSTRSIEKLFPFNKNYTEQFSQEELVNQLDTTLRLVVENRPLNNKSIFPIPRP